MHYCDKFFTVTGLKYSDDRSADQVMIVIKVSHFYLLEDLQNISVSLTWNMLVSDRARVKYCFFLLCLKLDRKLHQPACLTWCQDLGGETVCKLLSVLQN